MNILKFRIQNILKNSGEVLRQETRSASSGFSSLTGSLRATGSEIDRTMSSAPQSKYVPASSTQNKKMLQPDVF